MQLLHPKEEEVMYAIWNVGHPCVISELLRTHPTLKRNTVAKVLVILERKGYLAVDSIVKTVTRTGRAYVPVVSFNEYETQKKMISLIVESNKISDGILNCCSALIESYSDADQFKSHLSEMLS